MKINVKVHKNGENTRKILKISCVRCHFVQVDIYNIIGDELLLNFWREISVIICNFTCEITKLPWQPSACLSVKMATKF